MDESLSKGARGQKALRISAIQMIIRKKQIGKCHRRDQFLYARRLNSPVSSRRTEKLSN
jgi:hypothetical protein